ncbi:hypothetical protein SAMD00023353_3100590 [Rosellinia necatrix]|uniref:Uncharacterized protein n=1 Tax=Rosellinia necatrix TaxID=77044 RepID=A0A1W2TU10_ROSNE|nr:hypothetical protein SAMD00023353_3100590 [Rosellinia necatrix]
MLVTEPQSEQGAAVSLLILGAGWTSTFLLPLLRREGIEHAATTTNGRDGTIPFKFDPLSDDASAFAALPAARTVLITFPLEGEGAAARLVRGYAATHDGGDAAPPNYILFGATSIWTGADGWQDEGSPYDAGDARAAAEDELMRCAPGGAAAVLSLAGLYGGARQPRDWVRRVVRSKEGLRAKGALHVVHGEDVARAVLALHRAFTPRRRWILCDMHVYDWWDLVQDWAVQALGAGGAAAAASDEERARQDEMLAWVGELMAEEGVRALPRDASSVGRRLDGRAFWKHMGIWPTQGRMR